MLTISLLKPLELLLGSAIFSYFFFCLLLLIETDSFLMFSLSTSNRYDCVLAVYCLDKEV